MTQPTDDNSAFAAMERIWNTPAVRQCIAEIEFIAGYRLSPDQKSPFLRFHAFVSSDPPPLYISTWKSDDRGERWHRNHVGGILGHVQNTLACVFSHRDNLCTIEDAVRQILTKSGAKEVLGNTTIGLGNTIRWDAEYQAFVLAVRRCLDYLARALAAYFQNDYHSFRNLPKFLSGVKPVAVARAIQDAQQRHQGHFDYVLSDDKKKSIRDLLSHYEYISAGVLNLSQHGFLIVGGGEKIKPTGLPWEGGLSNIIVRRADDLFLCVSDIIKSFIDAAALYNKDNAT